ncbi:prepilin signal peptidase PulO-like peptidase [Desulfosporosinus acidiphilus SJ4]|uniref:Prepilin signal peptidase PulO-like peptidase n=1 Tax=Desulfosporosinus acidiphilus (strain DSM 22704 / JCM 16185 / SJ4) TaxID=646529 RepID=I4D3U9_DESAJ|nr:A24 family peptidase [Desulfosporosinus acidiphilus]AFM40473.1 prepilin signal peptidase PulO-like peptidase [Desulfosporosinus acidiphilus SJ4]
MSRLVYFHWLVQFLFVLLILGLSITDYCTMRLPDKFTIPLLGIGLLNAFLDGPQNGLFSLMTVLGFGLVFWLIAKAFPQDMGLGDVTFVTALSLFFGFPLIVPVIILACLTGLLTGTGLLRIRKTSLKQQLPFGPYLSFGSLIVLVWGNKILTIIGRF